MRPQFTQFEAMLYGNVRYQRAGWLIPLFIRFAPMGRDDVVDRTGISEVTAAKYLTDLAQLGIIIRQGYHDGYVLTAGGQQLIAKPLLEAVLEAGEPTEVTIDAVAQEPAESKGAIYTFVSSENQSLIIPESDPLIEEDMNHPQSVDAKGAICTFEKMIAHTDILFGDGVSGVGLKRRDFKYTLGWIAQAYVQGQNGKLHSPQALIYKRLKEPVNPPQRKYFEHPTDYLPDEYLSAIGLWRKTCDWCEVEITDLDAYNAHRGQCVMTRQQPEIEVVEVMADETVTNDVLQCWDGVLGRLQAKTPKASFETWMRDTTPVHCEGGVLTVAARNAFARDWLASRMTATVEKMAGMRGKFVAGVATETEEE